MISTTHWAKLSPEQKAVFIARFGLNPNNLEVEIPSKFNNDELAITVGKKGGTDYLWNELLNQLFNKVEIKEEVKDNGEEKEESPKKGKKIKRG